MPDCKEKGREGPSADHASLLSLGGRGHRKRKGRKEKRGEVMNTTIPSSVLHLSSREGGGEEKKKEEKGKAARRRRFHRAGRAGAKRGGTKEGRKGKKREKDGGDPAAGRSRIASQRKEKKKKKRNGGGGDTGDPTPAVHTADYLRGEEEKRREGEGKEKEVGLRP